MEDCLARHLAVRLNYVQSLRVDGSLYSGRKSGRHVRQLLGGRMIEGPNIGDVLSRNDESVTKCCGICWKEGHYVLIAIDLPCISIFAVDYLAKRAFRIACRHC